MFRKVFISWEVNLILEGTDQVNTETINGKDTFHSMARAVFQVLSLFHPNVARDQM